MRRVDRGILLELIGRFSGHDTKSLAALLHAADPRRTPVSLVVRAHVGADAVRGYCDEGTAYNRGVSGQGGRYV